MNPLKTHNPPERVRVRQGSKILNPTRPVLDPTRQPGRVAGPVIIPRSGIEHNVLECGDCKTFLPFISPDLSFTEIRYLAGDLRNVALSFLGITDTRALNFPSNDPRFKQLEKFLNNVRIFVFPWYYRVPTPMP